MAAKYGKTDFSFGHGDGTNPSYLGLFLSTQVFDSAFFMTEGEKASQWIVEYDKGGYFIVTHYVLTRDTLWHHGIEYHYIGDGHILTDNNRHELDLKIDDVL